MTVCETQTGRPPLNSIWCTLNAGNSHAVPQIVTGVEELGETHPRNAVGHPCGYPWTSYTWLAGTGMSESTGKACAIVVPKWALSRACKIHVNPLFVAGEAAESIDEDLVYHKPVAHSEVLINEFREFVSTVDDTRAATPAS